MAYIGPRKALLSSTALSPASLDLNFTPAVPFSRPSTATYFDVTGTMQTAANGIPRFDYGCAGVTNWVRNSTMVGAVVGTPGTLPTYWTIGTQPTGLSYQVVGTGIINGLSYIDIRWFGTAGSTGICYLRPEANFTATVGQTWTNSMYLAVVGGTLPAGASGLAVASTYFLPTGNTVSGSWAPSGTLTRYSVTGTSSGTVTYGIQHVGVQVSSGNVVDFTLRLAAPQMEIGSIVNTWVPTVSSPVTNFSAPGGITNWISNSTFVGAVAGSPGTLPTSWAISAVPSGLTRTIGFTTINGVSCITINYSGTTTSAASIQLSLCSPTPSAANQYWSQAVNYQVTQDDPSLTGIWFELWNLNSSLGLVSTGTNTNLYGGRLSFQRISLTQATLTGAAYVQPFIRTNTIPISTSINFTFVISQPQLERAYVSGPYVPTSGTVATVGNGPSTLLQEGYSYNYIRNPRCEGAIVADGVELTTNGTFSVNPLSGSQNTILNGWSWNTAGGTSTVTWSGSAVVLTGDGTNKAEIDSGPITTIVGRAYTLIADITGVNANVSAGVTRGDNTLLFVNSIGVGQIFTFVATTTTTYIGFAKTSVGSPTIDNVSLKSCGSSPTYWSNPNSMPTGITFSVVGSGYESGIPYVDYQFNGTPSANAQVWMYYDVATAITPNQIWTVSSYFRLVGGSLSNVTNLGCEINAAAGGYVLASLIPTSAPLSIQRISGSLTITSGGTSALSYFVFSTTSGQAISFTIRIGAPQFELSPTATSVILPAVGTPALTARALEFGTPIDPRIIFTRASSASYFDATGSLQLAPNNVPRLDFGPAPVGGVTNWVANSMMIGAVPGTPGTAPTTWSIFNSNANGLTTTIVGTGTENGLSYIDVQYTGTSTAASSVYMNIATAVNSNVVGGGTWTFSSYLKLAAGSLTGVTSTTLYILALSPFGGQIGLGSNSTIVPTGASLSSQRQSVSYTIPTGTTSVFGRLGIAIPISTAVNFTIRVGAPQMEIGASPTPWIATYGTPLNVGASPPKGFLIEESRTNSIRNPRAEGAVAADNVELTTNGTFSANPINASQNTVQNGWSWSIAGGTSTVVWTGGNSVTLTGDGTNKAELDSAVITTVVGRIYIITVDVTGFACAVTAGTTRGGATLLNVTSAVGTGQVFTFTANTTTTYVGFNKTSASGAIVANVSVKSGGTVPTNWAIPSSNGLVTSIVGFGTENGIPYIDLRFYGTATVGVSDIYFDTTTAAPAVVGQNWSISSYLRLVSGSLTNVTVNLFNIEYSSSSVVLAANQSASLTPTASSLSTQRYYYTTTIGNASTAYIQARTRLTTTAGAVDLTIRLGAPQLEQGMFVTSVTLPPVGSPSASGRSSDYGYMPWVASWPNSLVVDAIFLQTLASGQIGGLAVLSDGTSNNREIIRMTTSTSAAYVSAGTATAAPTVALPSLNTPYKTGVIAQPYSLYLSLNGSVPVLSAGNAPVAATMLYLGQNAPGGNYLDGYLRRIRYWSKAITGAQLQQVTT